MNYLDWFFIFILGSGIIWGYQKGFIKAILGFLAIGIALWIGFKFSGITESFVRDIESIPAGLVYILSLVVTIILIYFAIKIIGKILHGITHTIGLGIFNRLGGAIFGVLLNVLMLSALIYYVLPFFDVLFDQEIISESKILPHLQEVIVLFKTNFHLFADSLN
ncbi:MAG TPA: CvpA family protein [Moheibacter sp.]|nr:CvpA family protein [Moheibacter sp.]